MTPFEIDILLHYYARGGDHEVVSQNPPVWPTVREQFISDGLLRPCRNETATYALTERGRAYVEALKRVPLPVQVWVTRWPSEERR